MSLTEFRDCRKCEGEGKCPHCEGMGDRWCACPTCGNEHEEDCEDCGGDGKCMWCHGAGVVRITDAEREAAGQLRIELAA